jgi:endonuclease YncB( thermonuclease family)
MKFFKVLLNWLPIAAIAFLAFLAVQQYQASQATKPDYDQIPAAGVKGPAPAVGQSCQTDLVAVADGDTITFCGIDAPEVSHGEKAGQPFGQEAQEKLRTLIAAAGNRVIVSPAERDLWFSTGYASR